VTGKHLEQHPLITALDNASFIFKQGEAVSGIGHTNLGTLTMP